jgi:5-methyltetrahydropteroyltriglutamate--homocysteine methyltransferase
MRRSDQKILTTHAGRLQRPEEITRRMETDPQGRPNDLEFGGILAGAVQDVVRQQAELGIDIVGDGEFGKLSWATYVNGRLGGHEIVPGKNSRPPSEDRRVFAQFYEELDRAGATYYRSPGSSVPKGMRWACTGPVSYIGQDALRQDLDNLKSALSVAGIAEAFVPATSPIRPGLNAYYKTNEDYYVAIAEAMRTEYRAIVEAGFVLQIDDPHLAVRWHDNPGQSVSDYRKRARTFVEITNYGLEGIPEDRVRYHLCWGSWHGPHAFDLPLADIVDLMLSVRAQGYVFEAANAQHEHEFEIWRDVKLPAGKILIPGFVSHATVVVEHPELVALRIKNFAGLVGRENVIAGTDCGLGYRVHPQIAEAKLRNLAVGAAAASRALYRGAA